MNPTQVPAERTYTREQVIEAAQAVGVPDLWLACLTDLAFEYLGKLLTAARAQPAPSPQPADGWPGDYLLVIKSLGAALRRLTLVARTSGGVAGHDPELVSACEQAEQALTMRGIAQAVSQPAVPVVSDEQIIRAAVSAMPSTNPLVAEDLIGGHTMHTEAEDIVVIWKAGVQWQALHTATQPCGHPVSLVIRSAESGEALYCEACDDKSGRRDAEMREAELLEANQKLRDEILALRPAVEPMTDERAAFEARVVAEAGTGAISKWLGTEGYENTRVQDNRLGWVWCLEHLGITAKAEGGA